MSGTIRRVLALALVAAIACGVVFAGPLASGGFWLTSRASSEFTPETLPWLQPYHRGGIDFATGLYVRTDLDLITRGGDVPIVLRRTYRSMDPVSRAFGVGATHNGEWYLRGDGERFQWAELILDDGARVRYQRISRGSSFANAMFEHTSSPTVFYGSRIGWTGLRWALRWFDGSVAIFRACGAVAADTCSIVEMRGPAGHTVRYIRDGETHALRAIRSGTAEVSLEYDEQQRVTRVRDTTGQEVNYEYDSGGRLVRVIESTGVARMYTYDTRGAMLTIDEPGWHIDNFYDADGRCIHQATRWDDGRTASLDIAYTVRDGAIVEASKSWDNGPRTVYRFNEQRYLEYEERDPTGPAPVVITYSRRLGSNFSTGITVRCYDAQGRLRRTGEAEYEGERAVDGLVSRTCGE